VLMRLAILAAVVLTSLAVMRLSKASTISDPSTWPEVHQHTHKQQSRSIAHVCSWGLPSHVDALMLLLQCVSK
jgi:hypothetical protein